MTNTYMNTYLPLVNLTSLPQVGALLSARRRLLGLSEAALATFCEMPVDQVRRLERGQYVPAPSQACSLAQILGIDRDALSRWALKALFRHPQYLIEAAMRSEAHIPLVSAIGQPKGGEPCRSRRRFRRRSQE